MVENIQSSSSSWTKSQVKLVKTAKVFIHAQEGKIIFLESHDKSSSNFLPHKFEKQNAEQVKTVTNEKNAIESDYEKSEFYLAVKDVFKIILYSNQEIVSINNHSGVKWKKKSIRFLILFLSIPVE